MNTKMKEVCIPKTPLGPFVLEKAFDIVFGDETLKKVHGDSFHASVWDNDSRKISFSIPIDNIPNELKRFFCGDRMKLTNTQKKIFEPNTINIINRLKLHFIGAELFGVKPTFCLEYDENTKFSYISGRVEHRARLPVPLNIITETFMANNSKRELQFFGDVLKKEVTAELKKN